MKELVKWITVEVTMLIFCMVGTVGCSWGAKTLFVEATRDGLFRFIMYNFAAFIVGLLCIGFVLSLVLLITFSREIDSEILAEIRLRNKKG